MKSFTINSVGSPPTFDKSVTDATYWVERAHCEQSRNNYNAQQEGFGVYEPENTDIEDLSDWFSSACATLEAYGDAMIVWMRGDEVGDKPAKPELPSLPTYAYVFEKVVSEFLVCWHKAVIAMAISSFERIIGVSSIRLLDQIKDQEQIMHFDNYQVWVKSAAVDSNPNNP